MLVKADQAAMTSISPFFITADLDRTLAFYRDALAFDVVFLAPDPQPFFAIVRRGGAQLFFKVVGDNVAALPNPRRHPMARWDAFVHVPDPDALVREFTGRGVVFSAPLADAHDGLRGFEIQDPDGYVLFFGRPQ
jgi:catechol 2,3-dioxygenase-like lactoylglutathione lyase family enzyme